VATVRQVHGDALVVVQGRDGVAEVAGVEADGLLTDSPEVALAVFTADCLPVLIADPRRGAVAAVHSGWRGTAARISGAAVRRLTEEFGSRPEDLLVAVGPAIGPCCYEVDRPVLEKMEAAFPGVSGLFLTPSGGGKAFLDLRAAVAWDLKETGVRGENVTLMDECTACQAEWFFSYRREGRDTGRLAAIIGLREGKGCLEENGCPGETGPAAGGR
jgi:YfiH family protein